MTPPWLALSAWLAVGIALGTAYFATVWWSARRLAGGSGALAVTIAGSVARLVLLGACLALAARDGALPLLAMALGVLVARAAVMRRLKAPTP